MKVDIGVLNDLQHSIVAAKVHHAMAKVLKLLIKSVWAASVDPGKKDLRARRLRKVDDAYADSPLLQQRQRRKARTGRLRCTHAKGANSLDGLMADGQHTYLD